MRHLVVVLLCISVALAGASSVARADEPATNPALAEALFNEARRLEDEGQIAAACAKYAESQRQDPTLGTLLNLALCEEKLGRLVVAWTLWTRGAAEAARTGQTERAELARAHARELEPKLPRLQIDVPEGSGVTEVRVDGELLGSAAWGVPLPYDAGEHTVELAGSGRVSQTLHATTTTGRIERVSAPSLDVVLRAAEPAPVTAPPPAAPADEPAPRSSSTRILGYAALGIGAAGVGVGAVFGALALAKKAVVDDHCRAERCDPTGLDAVGSTRTFATISTIAFSVGLVAAAGGAYFVLFGERHATHAALGGGPSSLVLSGTW